jgi:sugar phosphate isomerase/epimerase
MGAGVASEFKKMKDRIRSTHVHDNDGVEDSHLFPAISDGGTIDWAEAMKLLRTCPAGTPLLLELREVPGMADPLGEVKRSFEQLESL